jgi:hypothetical protein
MRHRVWSWGINEIWYQGIIKGIDAMKAYLAFVM